MAISLADVIAYGGVLCEGDLLIPSTVEFGVYNRDGRADTPKVPKVLKMDAPSVYANVCDMFDLAGRLDAKPFPLVRSDGAPLEMYGFCKRYKQNNITRFTIRAASNTSSGSRFVLCKELMQVACFGINQNDAELGVGQNLLRSLNSKEKFAETLSDIVRLVAAPWVDNVRNPADLNDETAAFYMALEVLIPRRLHRRMASCMQETIGRKKAVGFAFAVPMEVAEHFFKSVIVKDAQGGVKCSYYDYRRGESSKACVQEKEERLREVVASGRKSAKGQGN